MPTAFAGASMVVDAASAQDARDSRVSGSTQDAAATQAPPVPAGDDARVPGRRDRGARGAMPLPPDWPRAGGFGTRERGLIEGLVTGDIAGADLSRREITDEELARAIAVARRVSEDWGRTLAARAEQDPAQMKAALRTTGRRLFGLLLLEERAPRLFELKIAELRAQGETARAADELKRAQGAGAGEAAAGADADRIAAIGAALDAAVTRQIEATMAVRREELVAIEARIAEMRRDIERDAAGSRELAEEIKSRALAPRQTDSRGDGAGGNDPRGNDLRGNDPRGNDPRGNDPRGEPGTEGDRRGGREERRGPRDGAGAPREPGANPPDAPDRNP